MKLYVYPGLFGLPDNNPFGLKVDTFLRLAKVDYDLVHIVDTSQAPRGQLPYLKDDEEIITESNTIIDYVTSKHQLTLVNTAPNPHINAEA